MPHTRRVRAKGRHDTCRQRLLDKAHALENAAPSEIQLDVVLKDDIDHGEPEGGLRPDDAYSGESLEIRRERIRDLVLHFLWTVSGPVREDNHLVVGQVG